MCTMDMLDKKKAQNPGMLEWSGKKFPYTTHSDMQWKTYYLLLEFSIQ